MVQCPVVQESTSRCTNKASRPLAEIVDLVSRYRALAVTPLRRLTAGSVTIPCLIIASINAYNLWTEHWEHWEHLPPLEERTEYPYQNIRTKNFCWGDGDKVRQCGPACFVREEELLTSMLFTDFIVSDYVFFPRRGYREVNGKYYRGVAPIRRRGRRKEGSDVAEEQ